MAPARKPEEDWDFDTVLLMERAEFAHKLIRTPSVNVDPYEVLASVVWPSPYAVQEQIASRADRGLPTSQAELEMV